MFQLKVKEALAAKFSLEKVIEHTKQHPLDFEPSIKIGRLYDRISVALEEIKYEEKNNENIKELGEEQFEKNDKGEFVMVKVEGSEEEKRKSIGWQINPDNKNFNEYIERTSKLQEQNLEIVNAEKMKSSDLNGLKMPITDLAGFFFLIEKDSKEN